MAVRIDHPVFDGTTGKGDHGGRRTHIIRILRDSKEALTVEQVAKKVGIPSNAARYHLESLVDSGLATRESQGRTTPGRPRVAYLGTLPNQTHERAQGYRLLAEIMAAGVAQSSTSAGEWMYQIGTEWGRYITCRDESDAPVDESRILERLANKLDALWFAPEVVEGSPVKIVMHNCPFMDSTRRFPQVVCQLHAGMINGSLEEAHSAYRMVHLRVQDAGHRCEGELGKTTARMSKVALDVRLRVAQAA
ncbi:MAG: helix-turn-helix domain-containing protein [Propionibacteriaceae bacterium]|nr:helix-turn-helix domain-containing protein [Propionibacteriaceae bacterium]